MFRRKNIFVWRTGTCIKGGDFYPATEGVGAQNARPISVRKCIFWKEMGLAAA